MTQKEVLQKMVAEPILFEEPLANHTSIKIGGPAMAFITPKDETELVTVLQWAKTQKLSHCIFGKGSNTLVRDGGFPGVVLSLTKAFREWKIERQENNFVWVRVQGGVPTQQFVRWGSSLGLKGIEFLAGIPGTLGGNVVMNAGTTLGSISELIEEVTVIDQKGKRKNWLQKECHFTYRSSEIPTACVVVDALLKLEQGEVAGVEEKVKALFESRGLSQPVTQPNLGSVFKNPTHGKTKLAKAWELIDEAGLRGVRVGKARISEKHTNFIVNEGGATARDVMVLINLVKERVRAASGILLETEVKIIGEDAA